MIKFKNNHLKKIIKEIIMENVDPLNESPQIKWLEYDELSNSQKSAVYEYMVTSGGVEENEYEKWVGQFQYKIQLIDPKKILPVMDKWGWQIRKPIHSHDEKRISKIKSDQNKTKKYWPYVVAIGKTFKVWAKDEMNHGDGFHRLVLALRENRPIEFMFLKNKAFIKENITNDFTALSGGLDKTSLNYWLSPTGEFIRIPLQGHNTWASQYIQNQPDKYVEKAVQMSPQNILYRENWIKMVLYDIHGEPILRIEYYPENPPNQTQEKAMLDFVHDFNANPDHPLKITHIQDDTKRIRKCINENLNENLNEWHKHFPLKVAVDPHGYAYFWRGNRPAGSFVLTGDPKHPLSSIVVQRSLQGTGIGHAMIEFAFKKTGLDTLRIYSSKSQPFYLKIGGVKKDKIIVDIHKSNFQIPKFHFEEVPYNDDLKFNYDPGSQTKLDFHFGLHEDTNPLEEVKDDAYWIKNAHKLDPEVRADLLKRNLNTLSATDLQRLSSHDVIRKSHTSVPARVTAWDWDRPEMAISENKLNERLSFADLYDDTDDERIFKSKLPGMSVRSMDISMENGNETWNFNATSQEKSQYKRHGGKTSHRSRIIFFKDSVEPQDNAKDLDCMVDCDCKDFQFRFAYVNAQDDASMIGGKSLNKAINRPPIKTNPKGHQQLCKHLAALTRYLVTNIDRARQRARLRNRNRPVNIFEAMNELANKGHDKWEYYDKDDSLNEGLERVGQDPSKQKSRMPINWNAPDLWAHSGWNEQTVREFAGLSPTFQSVYRTILNVSDLNPSSIEDDPTKPIDYDWSEFRRRKNGFPPIIVMRDENQKLHIMDGNHRVKYAENVGYQTIGAWVVDKLLQKHIDQKSLQETRIIRPEESLSEGYITLYHGTIWPIALKAKKGELGPQDMQKLIIEVLVEIFHETPQEAKKYYDKYASLRRKDPPRLFLTTSRKGAEGYARSNTKWGGELFYDVISNYMYEKEKNIDRESLSKKLKTDEPAIVTINVPIEMVLTHPHWTTPLKHRLRDIMVNLKKYPDIKDSPFDDFNIEVFVKEKIPARFIQRIDKVGTADQE